MRFERWLGLITWMSERLKQEPPGIPEKLRGGVRIKNSEELTVDLTPSSALPSRQFSKVRPTPKLEVFTVRKIEFFRDSFAIHP